MKRRSILIAAISASPFNLSQWEAFLLSSSGGAWGSDEVVKIENADRETIVAAVDSSKGADYCLVVAVGHAETAKRGRPWRETHLILGNDSEVSERDLNNGSPRCLLVFDGCLAKGSSEELETITVGAQTDSQSSREAYDAAIMSAEGGLVKVIGSNSSGPVSRELIHEGIIWASEEKGVLFLPDAIKRTVDASKESRLPRQIEYIPGRRQRHFPFAVNA